MENSKKSKVPCPNCKGNGYVRVPYELAKEEVIVQCGVCESQGEVNEDEIDNIIKLIPAEERKELRFRIVGQMTPPPPC